jgi:hypothetical protein
MASLSSKLPVSVTAASLQHHPVFSGISSFEQFNEWVEGYIGRVTGGRLAKGSRATTSNTTARRDAIHKASGFVLVQMIQGSWSDIQDIASKQKGRKTSAQSKRTKKAVKDVSEMNSMNTGKALSKQEDDDAEYTALFKTIFDAEDVFYFDGFRSNHMTHVADATQCNKVIQYRIDSNQLNLDTTGNGYYADVTEEEKIKALKSLDKARILYLRRKNCYICQQPMWVCKNADPSTVLTEQEILPSAECEHILPLFFALKHLWVVDKNWDELDSNEKNYISTEYEYSHMCCNRAKTNTPWIMWIGGVCHVNSINVQKTFAVIDKRAASGDKPECEKIINMMRGEGISMGGKKLTSKYKKNAGKFIKERVNVIVEKINIDVEQFSEVIPSKKSSSKNNPQKSKSGLEWEDGYTKYSAWSKLKAISILSTTDIFGLLTHQNLLGSDILEKSVEIYNEEESARLRNPPRSKQGGNKTDVNKILEKFSFDPKTITFWCFLTFGFPELDISPPTMIYSKEGTTIELNLHGKKIRFINENIYKPSEDLQNLKNFVFNEYEKKAIVDKPLGKLPMEPFSYASGNISNSIPIFAKAGGAKKTHLKRKTHRKNRGRKKNKTYKKKQNSKRTKKKKKYYR